MRYRIGLIILLICSCSHNEPELPDRSNAIDRNKQDTISEVNPTDTVISAPGDTIPAQPPTTDERPQGAVIPDVDKFYCTPYGSDEYKIEFWIANSKECGVKSATIFYGTEPDKLKPVTAEFYARNGHIVANVTDINDNTDYYMGCRIYMVGWYFDSKLWLFRHSASVNF